MSFRVSLLTILGFISAAVFAQTVTVPANVTYNDDGTISIQFELEGTQVVVEPPESEPPVVEPPTEPQVCSASGTDLNKAKAAFAAACPGIKREDCDPDNGGWVCSSAPIGSKSPSTPVTPVTPPTPQEPVQVASLRIEAESLNLTSGWSSYGDYIEWFGSTERYTQAQINPDAHVVVPFAVPKTGKYRFNMRARTTTFDRLAEGKQLNRAEPGNDIWMQHPDHGWMKVWFNRDGNWHANAVGEHAGAKNQQLLDMQLSQGTYNLVISGRSRATAIDWFELEPQGFSVAPESVCKAKTLAELERCSGSIQDGGTIQIGADLQATDLSVVISGLRNVTIDGQGHKVMRVDNQRARSFLRILDSHSVVIKNLTMDDDARDPSCVVADSCAFMVYVENSTNVIFNGVHITNGKRYVVYVRNTTGFQFLNSKLTNSGVLGMYIGHDQDASTNTVIRDSEFYDNSTNALALLGANGVLVEDNIFLRNHNVGQWPVAPQFGTGMTGGGQIYVAKARDVIIQGNTIADGSCSSCKGGVHGIELSEPNKSDSVFNVQILGNNLGNHTGSKIYTNSGATVQNLRISDESETATKDLLLLHYDAYPDTDDWQAVIAGKYVVDTLGLSPTVVVGAHGLNNITNGGWIQGSEVFFRTLYAQTLDAYNDRQLARESVANQIVATLDRGGIVNIAEGGPSDFSAEVLRAVYELRPQTLRGSIHVWQHSVTWNEVKTLPGNLAFVKANTTYHVVADGNGPNASADLQASASEAICQRFQSSVSRTDYAAQWVQAYAKMGDSRKCDASDTVELLAIIGDKTTRNFDDFAARYVN